MLLFHKIWDWPTYLNPLQGADLTCQLDARKSWGNKRWKLKLYTDWDVVRHHNFKSREHNEIITDFHIKQHAKKKSTRFCKDKGSHENNFVKFFKKKKKRLGSTQPAPALRLFPSSHLKNFAQLGFLHRPIIAFLCLPHSLTYGVNIHIHWVWNRGHSWTLILLLIACKFKVKLGMLTKHPIISLITGSKWGKVKLQCRNPRTVLFKIIKNPPSQDT